MGFCATPEIDQSPGIPLELRPDPLFEKREVTLAVIEREPSKVSMWGERCKQWKQQVGNPPKQAAAAKK